MTVVLALDEATARHLAVAIGDHIKACERNGWAVPAGVRALFEVAVADSSRPLADVGGHDLGGVVLPAHDATVSYEQAAARLGVSTRTVGRMVAAGRLVRVSRRVTLASLAAVEGRSA